MSSLSNNVRLAYEMVRSGRPDEAERLCREVLRADASEATALHLLGWLCFQTDRRDEALTCLERMVASHPADPRAHYSLGELYRRAGQLPKAEASFREALRLDSGLPAAWYQLGLAASGQQKFAEAAAALREALRLQPELAEAHDALSQVHYQTGDRQAALRELQRVVECRPSSAEACNNLGNLQLELGLVREAIASLEQATRLQPELALAHYNLGNALRAANRLPEAAAGYQRALQLSPYFVAAVNNLGTVLQSLGDREGARRAFSEVVRLEPRSGEAHYNLGILLREARQYAEAKGLFERAVALDPLHAPSHYNLGATLVDLGEYEAARLSLLEALRLQPQYAHPYCTLGIISQTLGDHDAALAHFDRALAIDPEHAEAHVNRGALLLSRGDHAGWQECEWRWQVRGALQRPSAPLWNGEPLAGRTILLYPEQGLGDTLQFIRFAPLVKARGGRVLLRCGQRMIPILSTCRGIDRFYSEEDPWPPFDVHASLMSLPSALATDAASIPVEIPYLTAPAKLIEDWREALPQDACLRVGINWQGDPNFARDRHRSIPLREFAPLGEVAGVRFFSLQKGAGVEQLADAPFPIENLDRQTDETAEAFCQRAAVMMNLDLVITSDTSLAHLAGALGVPVWVALSRVADWRWLVDGEMSPWYPTMRLFRQRTLDRWSEVFTAMAARLRELVRERTPAANPAPSLVKAFELHRAGRIEEAQAAYRDLVAADSANAEAWHLLGVTEHQLGRHREAVDHIRRAIELAPAQPMFQLNLSTVYSSLGQPDDAIAAMREAARLEPKHAKAHNDLGVLLVGQRRWDEAAEEFRSALAVEPDFSPALANLGNVLNQLRRPQKASEFFQRAIQLDPQFASAYNGLGNSLHAQGRNSEALDAYRRAIELNPRSAEGISNLGQLLGDLGDFDAAIARFEEAAKIEPENAAVRNNRGIYALLKGDFPRGWQDYEARWQLPEARQRPPGPTWSGQPLAGRTILLYTEQGLGDTLQFVRYAPLVQARGGRVVVRCAGRMIPILRTCAGIDAFVAEDEPWPEFDCSAALVSLPGIFQTDLASIPAAVPYLFAGQESVDRARSLVPGGRGLRVGINWQGHPEYRGDHRRSIPLALFAPLAEVAGVRLFSLQKGAGTEQLGRVSFAVEDVAGPLDEVDEAFCQTAGIIKNLDLVITSDTAIAHLAGALAAPVWVALPLAPDWRWLLHRDDSPWYPTMRLFRQSTYGRWDDVFAAMAEALETLVSDAQGRRPVSD